MKQWLKNAILLFMLFLFLAVALYMASSPSSKQGQMKLLAVSELENGTLQGAVANIYLNIRPGNGRVYIDTFPITKLDTQLSTRFAMEMACNFVGENCQKFDFFYTLRSESPTIGGPSAGAALTVLTISVLDDLELDKNVLITGTINSGGLIGAVGGIKEKIEAASGLGIDTLLIARGSVIFNNTDYDVFSYGKKNDIEVIKVGELREAVYQMTGKRYEPLARSLSVNGSYQKTMRNIAIELCNRSQFMIERLNMTNKSTYEVGLNLSVEGAEDFAQERYYSSASRCFGANIQLKHAYYDSLNMSPTQIESELDRIEQYHDTMMVKLNEIQLRTVTDLQTFIVVDERLLEASRFVRSARESLKSLNESPTYLMAYGFERLISAKSWSKFFGTPGNIIDLDKSVLERSCIRKLSEAQERIQYVRSFLPLRLEETNVELDNAYSDFAKGDYELCLFRASKAKAELDVIVSVLGVGDEGVTDLLVQKLDLARLAIAEEIARGNFPILGYSYYEYAGSLYEQDQYSALIYAEYALELSDLEIYLAKIEGNSSVAPINVRLLSLFVSGAIFGLILGFILYSKRQ